MPIMSTSPISAAQLQRVYTAFSTILNAAFEKFEVWYEKVAMTVGAPTRVMDYRFILDFPMMRQWVDERQLRSLDMKAYLVTTLDWEATIEVDRNDIEDDMIGLYAPMIESLGQEAKKHPDHLIAQAMAAGFTALCYDGQPFFSATHPVGATQVSNMVAGSGSTWYLLDTNRAIKPFIFQLRRGVQLVRMDRPEDEQVFMQKKFRYGVDYRAVATYGLWQLCYASQQPLTADNYAAARSAMMSFKNVDGRPLGILPNLMVVPPSLEEQGREILQADFIMKLAMEGTTGVAAAVRNVWQKTADLLVAPELS